MDVALVAHATGMGRQGDPTAREPTSVGHGGDPTEVGASHRMSRLGLIHPPIG
jgi:hypothetical protein